MCLKVTDAMEKCIKMLSEEVAEKIKKELSSFFGTELASIVLYGSYAEGRGSKYSDIDISTTLRNFNPLLLNILKHGIPLLDDGTFATVKEEFQRMLDAKIIESKEEYWVVTSV
jgi:predicted nucleotidyltransferase